MTHKAFLPLLVFSAGLTFFGAPFDGYTPVTPKQVVIAMNAAGLNVTAQQVLLPGNVMANTPSPALTVGAIERWGDSQLRVRIDCVNRTECIPFFVAVQAPLPPNHAARSQMFATAPEPLSHSVPASNPFLVRSGSSAHLLLEGEHIRIQLPVVCLENGRAGDTIRVTSEDGRQTYSVEVISRTELKGRLE